MARRSRLNGVPQLGPDRLEDEAHVRRDRKVARDRMALLRKIVDPDQHQHRGRGEGNGEP